MKLLISTIYINCDKEYQNARIKTLEFHEFANIYNEFGIFQVLRCLYELYLLVSYKNLLSNNHMIFNNKVSLISYLFDCLKINSYYYLLCFLILLIDNEPVSGIAFKLYIFKDP